MKQFWIGAINQTAPANPAREAYSAAVHEAGMGGTGKISALTSLLHYFCLQQDIHLDNKQAI